MNALAFMGDVTAVEALAADIERIHKRPFRTTINQRILVHIKSGHLITAHRIYESEFSKWRLNPTPQTFCMILEGCVRMKNWNLLNEMMLDLEKSRLPINSDTFNAVVSPL